MGVAGSSPVSRLLSLRTGASEPINQSFAVLLDSAPWPSGKAEDCKSSIPGSNPGGAS